MNNFDLAKIKSIYKSLPKGFSYPLTFVPFSLFCGSIYRSKFNELVSLDESPAKVISDIRDKRLVTYLNDSIKYTKYYADFAKRFKITEIVDAEQLFDFPVLCKDEIQENLDYFLDSRYENRRYQVTTGGTTGKQTSLYMSNDCYGLEWAFVNHYLFKHGIDVNSKRLCLRGVTGIDPDKLLGYNPLYKELLISPFRLNEDSILDNIQEIKKYNPKWIHGYPSSTKEFALILDSLNIKLDQIKHVLLVSEKLYPEQIASIEKALNAKILSFYGMTERVIFAPLVDGIYIPNQLYGVTEEINGELIGTGFMNSATRLIRYRTGDQAKVTKVDNFVTKIDELTGRWGKEYLLGMSGVKITMTSLNTHCDALKHVKKYQFYQTKVGHCDLLLEVDDKFNANDLLIVSNVFQSKVGNELFINSRIVEKVLLTKRGKHQFIVSELI